MTVILCCPGPSLAKEVKTLDKARSLGFQIFGCNAACYTYPRLDATLLVDEVKTFPEIKNRPFPLDIPIITRPKTGATWKALGHEVVEIQQTRCACNGRRPFDNQAPIIMHHRNESLNNGVLWALQCLYYLQAKKVILVGSELKFEQQVYAYPHKELNLNNKQSIYNRVVARFDLYKDLIGSRILYATVGGALSKMFETLPLEEAIQKETPCPISDFRTLTSTTT